MRSVMDGYIGVIANARYRVEVWKSATAPKLAMTEGPWIYISKLHHVRADGDISIGLPVSDLPELIQLLETGRD